MRFTALAAIAIYVWAILACGRAPDDPSPVTSIRYLALGDSYTIGESVASDDRWPVLLAALLRAEGLDIAEPEIIARTGWTASELAAAITDTAPKGPFDLVSLLIGVNNQYRGHPPNTYRTEFRALLETAIALASGTPNRVIVLSIPDWGVTPFAEGRDRALIAGEIDAFNAINRAESEALGVAYIDITPISREAAAHPSLIATDGLHPSGTMYALWAERALEDALAALKLPE